MNNGTLSRLVALLSRGYTERQNYRRSPRLDFPEKRYAYWFEANAASGSLRCKVDGFTVARSLGSRSDATV